MSTEPVSPELTGAPTVRASLPVPPWMLVVVAVTVVQMGAAVAEGLFETIGFASVVFLRCFIGGLIFLGLVRPRILGYSRRVYLLIAMYGITIAANMLTFYAAIDRIPLGIAVAIAFAGPLTVSVAGSRRAADLIWVALAAAGILLLSPITDATLDPVGLLLAFVCAVAWGTYILVTKRAGNALPGNTMLALSMCTAAIIAAPFGAVRSVEILRDPALIVTAIIVALLSSVIPFWLEFKALRSLAPRVFSLLLSLEPVAAVVMGWLILHETLGVEKIIGIGMVTIAAAATTRNS